jgi:DNA mismatch repair protein MLH1
MDPTNRTLESMIAPSDPSQLVAFTTQDEDRPSKRRGVHDDPIDVEADDKDEVDQLRGTVWSNDKDEKRAQDIAESLCEFTSIRELRKESKKRGNAGERRWFQSSWLGS